jgi:hypothetical protein
MTVSFVASWNLHEQKQNQLTPQIDVDAILLR